MIIISSLAPTIRIVCLHNRISNDDNLIRTRMLNKTSGYLTASGMNGIHVNVYHPAQVNQNNFVNENFF